MVACLSSLCGLFLYISPPHVNFQLAYRYKVFNSVAAAMNKLFRIPFLPSIPSGLNFVLIKYTCTIPKWTEFTFLSSFFKYRLFNPNTCLT